MWKSFLGRSSDAPVRTPNLLLPSSRLPQADQRVAQAAEALEAAAELDPPPALADSGAAAGPVAVRAAAPAAVRRHGARHRHRRRCARAPEGSRRVRIRRSRWRSRCSTAPSWDALSPERPLRYWRLHRDHAAGRPAADHQRAARRRADRQLLQGPELPRRSAGAAAVAARCSAPAPDLPPSHQRGRRHDHPALEAAASRTAACRSCSCSAPMRPASSWSRATSPRRLGLQLYRLPAALLPSQPADLETFARLWHRESLLLPLALYVDALDAPEPTSPPAPRRR